MTPSRWTAITVTAIAADLITKWLATQLSTDVGPLRPRTNPELALGAFSLNSPVWQLTILAIATVGVLTHTVVLSRTNRLSWVALALLVAGAAANAVDRIVTGAVHDWLWLGWVIANIADAWLIVGLGMYMVAAWRSTEPHEATTPSIAGA